VVKRISKGVAATVLAVGVTGATGCNSSAPAKTREQQATDQRTAAENDRLFKENYAKLKEGTTYDEVDQLLPGEFYFGRKMRPPKGWTSEIGGRHAIYTFEDGVLESWKPIRR
jgi:hypothetical protein